MQSGTRPLFYLFFPFHREITTGRGEQTKSSSAASMPPTVNLFLPLAGIYVRLYTLIFREFKIGANTRIQDTFRASG